MSDGISKILPPEARSALLAAARIEPGKPRTMSQERTNALDRAIREIKAKNPKLFKGT